MLGALDEGRSAAAVPRGSVEVSLPRRAVT
jgi:hypothetical protein